MNGQVQQLVREIVQMGSDDKERAAALGVSPRTITEYKAGRFPRIITILLERNIVVLRKWLEPIGAEEARPNADCDEEDADVGAQTSQGKG